MRSIVLIVDDHPLVAEAFELAIGAAYPDVDVMRASIAAEAEAIAGRNPGRIKLVLLDLMLPDATGFSAMTGLQRLLPGAAIAIVSGRIDAEAVATARTLGAKAYLSKSAPVHGLVEAVGALLRGEPGPFPDAAPSAAADEDFQRRLATLSGAQLRVLAALADGRLNKQIAGDMNLTEGTVKQHLSAIFKKLGVGNRSQAILAARPFLKDFGAA